MRSGVVGQPGSSLHKRLIILLADTPIPKVRAIGGDYHDIFSTLFNSSINSISAPLALQIDSYDVVEGDYPSDNELRSADALLITGSAASAYDDDTLWIRNLVATTSTLPSRFPSLRLIGICFGHQILAEAFGGVCEPSEAGWELGVRHLNLTPLGCQLLPHDADSTVAIHQIHRDHVPSVPEGFELLGSTVDCYNQGMVRFGEDGKVHMISVQGHPEYNPKMVGEVIDARERKGILSKEVAAKSRAYAREHDDGVAIGVALLRVVGIIET